MRKPVSIMGKTEFTTMVMVQDAQSGKVLVQDRIKNWRGLSFSGGHVEDRESFYDCAVREIKEETGLDIANLKHCGMVHYANNKTFDRYLVFLYKTTEFSGELLSDTDEGKNYWITIDELKVILNSQETNTFYRYPPMFFEDKYSEAFGSWNDDEPCEIVYK